MCRRRMRLSYSAEVIAITKQPHHRPFTPPNFFFPSSRRLTTPILQPSPSNILSSLKMSSQQKIAIVSVYDKTGLLDLAKGLVQQGVRILASGGTSKMIRESGFPVEYVPRGASCASNRPPQSKRVNRSPLIV